MKELGFSKKDNYSRCINSATYSLAMREHSRLELLNKLKSKPFSEGVNLNELLNELEEKDYLNEERFVESYIRSRSRKGYGPVKIKSELTQKGLIESVIKSSLEKSKINWYELAYLQREKKFSSELPTDYKDKVKQMRYLFNRGFNTEQINSSFDAG